MLHVKIQFKKYACRGQFLNKAFSECMSHNVKKTQNKLNPAKYLYLFT